MLQGANYRSSVLKCECFLGECYKEQTIATDTQILGLGECYKEQNIAADTECECFFRRMLQGANISQQILNGQNQYYGDNKFNSISYS